MKLFKTFLILIFFAVMTASILAQGTAEDEFEGYDRNISQTDQTKPAKTPTPPAKPIKKPEYSVGKPGMKIWLERQTVCDGRFSLVAPTSVFRTGDCVRAKFRLNFEGFLTIINLGTSGMNTMIFPDKGQSGKIFPKSDYYLPDNKGWEFFADAGDEQLVFIVSNLPLDRQFIDDFLGKRNLIDQNAPDIEVYDRDLKPRTENDSVYVLADEKRLESGIIFRMTLKHRAKRE